MIKLVKEYKIKGPDSMFIFIRLYLAHLIGDFPLQTNTIFRMKLKGWIGTIPHVLVIMGSCILLSWPYLHLAEIWYFIVFIGITHLVQDNLKIRYGSGPEQSLWTYILDQLSHLGLIALILLTPLRELTRPVAGENIFIQIYNNDTIMVYIIAMILATYNGFYLIKTYHITRSGKEKQVSPLEKWYGMAERALIVSFFLMDGVSLYILPAIMVMRPLAYILFKDRLKLQKDFVSRTDSVLSWGIAILCGSALLLFQSCNAVY